MPTREILDADLDSMLVLEELATDATTDSHGLTLGDVSGHRIDRYYTIWRTLNFVGEFARLGLIRPTDVLESIGATVQDNAAIDVFQAAHVLPCDFSINGSAGMHTLFHSPIIRAIVKRDLFGRTNAVHKLVNYVDSRCEAQGWWQAFQRAIESVIAGESVPKVFDQVLVSGFARAVAIALEDFEERITAAERAGMHAAVLGPSGLPATPRLPDFRISKSLTNPKSRGINKMTVLQVFADYRLGPAGLSPGTKESAAREAAGWAELERDWRAKHG